MESWGLVGAVQSVSHFQFIKKNQLVWSITRRVMDQVPENAHGVHVGCVGTLWAVSERF